MVLYRPFYRERITRTCEDKLIQSQILSEIGIVVKLFPCLPQRLIPINNKELVIWGNHGLTLFHRRAPIEFPLRGSSINPLHIPLRCEA